MGRNLTEWNVATWTSRDLGNTSQPHLHGCWKIREQTRSCNHAEQRGGKKNCWHQLHQWTRHQNNDHGQPPSHWFDECVFPTLEVCGPPHRKDVQNYRETHAEQQEMHHLSLVETSTLSWALEWDLNVKVLANTHSTKATKEVTGWKVGWW